MSIFLHWKWGCLRTDVQQQQSWSFWIPCLHNRLIFLLGMIIYIFCFNCSQIVNWNGRRVGGWVFLLKSGICVFCTGNIFLLADLVTWCKQRFTWTRDVWCTHQRTHWGNIIIIIIICRSGSESLGDASGYLAPLTNTIKCIWHQLMVA